MLLYNCPRDEREIVLFRFLERICTYVESSANSRREFERYEASHIIRGLESIAQQELAAACERRNNGLERKRFVLAVEGIQNIFDLMPHSRNMLVEATARLKRIVDSTTDSRDTEVICRHARRVILESNCIDQITGARSILEYAGTLGDSSLMCDRLESLTGHEKGSALDSLRLRAIVSLMECLLDEATLSVRDLLCRAREIIESGEKRVS